MVNRAICPSGLPSPCGWHTFVTVRPGVLHSDDALSLVVALRFEVQKQVAVAVSGSLRPPRVEPGLPGREGRAAP